MASFPKSRSGPAVAQPKMPTLPQKPQPMKEPVAKPIVKGSAGPVRGLGVGKRMAGKKVGTAALSAALRKVRAPAPQPDAEAEVMRGGRYSSGHGAGSA